MLTEKQRKHQRCYPEKLINKNLTDEEIVSFNQRQITGQARFAYPPLVKAFEKQTNKQTNKQTKQQVGAIKSVDF